MILCAFLFLEGRPSGLGAKGFALHTLRERLDTQAAFSGDCTDCQRYYCAHLRRVSADFLFSYGEISPTRTAGMTDATNQVVIWPLVRVQSFPLFLLPKRRKALRINQIWKGVWIVKHKRLWKPGGRPRRGTGSMRLNRRKDQRIRRTDAARRKGANILGAVIPA